MYFIKLTNMTSAIAPFGIFRPCFSKDSRGSKRLLYSGMIIVITYMCKSVFVMSMKSYKRRSYRNVCTYTFLSSVTLSLVNRVTTSRRLPFYIYLRLLRDIARRAFVSKRLIRGLTGILVKFKSVRSPKSVLVF